MIKNTITRIKRVCAIAFIPRVLRGDLRYIPGKFEKLSYGIQRSAQKSTGGSKSSVGRRKCRGKRPEDPQKYAVSTVCENSVKPECSKGTCCCDKCAEEQNIIPSNVAAEETTVLLKPTATCRCADRHRVIAAIFSEPDNISIQSARNIPYNLLSNTTTHFGMNDDSSDGTLIKDKRINPGTYTINNNAKSFGIEKKKEKSEEINSLAKESRTSPNNDVILASDDCDLGSNLINANSCKLTREEEEKNHIFVENNDISRPSEEYKTINGIQSVDCEPSMAIDTETLNVYKTLLSKNTNPNLDDTAAATVNNKQDIGIEIANCVPESSEFSWNTETKDKVNSIVAATTSKEENERLTQKLEHVEETPMVETEKTKIEGFNVTPKVLGNMQKIENYADNNIDKTAKRCLGSSHRQVDEFLIREMEKLGIPLNDQKDTVSQKNSDSSATSELVGTNKCVSKLENELTKSKAEKQLGEQFIYDFNRTQIRDDLVSDDTKAVKSNWFQNSKPSATPLVTDKDLVKRSETKENFDTVNEYTWDQNQLDPQHVLTCNETCPISPKPLTENRYSCFEHAQAIYERDNVTSADKTQECTKQSPILEHENPCDSNKSGNILIRNTIKAASSAMAAAPEKEILNEEILSAKPTKANDSPIKYPLPRHINSTENYQSNTTGMHQQCLEKKSSHLGSNDAIKGNLLGSNDSVKEQSPSKNLQITNEKLQVTSNELLTTSEQLQETSEKLQAATEILQTTTKTIQQVNRDSQEVLNIRENTSKDLEKASETMQNASKKFGSIVTNLESTTEKLQDLCENVEQLILKNVVTLEKSTAVGSASTILPNQILNTINSQSNTSTNSEPQVDNTNTLFAVANNMSPALEALPKINDDTKLSELMKAVQHRNKLIESSNYLATSQKRKSVPPLNMPMQNSPIRVIPNYPSLRPKPKVCTPKPPKPKVKFSRCDPSTFNRRPNVLDSVYYSDVAMTEEVPNLPDEIMSKLLKLGCILKSTYQEKKENTMEAFMWARSCHRSRRPRLFRSKNYEPWIPIPSWPKQEKSLKQKLQSPKDGCKSFPPTCAQHDPPCQQHACETFPIFPRRKFSKLSDYHAVLLTKDHAKDKIIDLVRNEYSPILSRAFNKTEWTKPKFTEKPYTDSRQNEEMLKAKTIEVKPMQQPKKIERKNNSSNYVPKFRDLTINSNNDNSKLSNLNLEKLLHPTLATVSYSIIRYYSDGHTQGADEIFWRPKCKIPTEEQIRNMRDGRPVSMSLGNDAKYLLLSFKCAGEKPAENKSCKETRDADISNSSMKQESPLTNGESQAEIVQKVH